MPTPTDFSKPLVGDNYATLLPALVVELQNIVMGLDPALTGTHTNIPVGAKRFNESTNNWERYSGSAWGAYANAYAISISGTAAIATKSSNLAGGLVGQIPYQSALDTTAFLAAGTAGYVLQSNAGAAPSWVNPGSFSVSYATTSGACSGTASYATNAGTATTANSLNTSNGYTVAGLTLTSSYGEIDLPLNYAGQSYATYFYKNSSTAIGYYGPALGSLWNVDYSGNFNAKANVTAYSDERVKTNWRDLPTDFVTNLARLKSGIYDRTDCTLTQVGVGAQSLRLFLPEAVIEGEEGKLSVAYGNTALAACVALAREIESLKARLEAVEGK